MSSDEALPQALPDEPRVRLRLAHVVSVDDPGFCTVEIGEEQFEETPYVTEPMAGDVVHVMVDGSTMLVLGRSVAVWEDSEMAEHDHDTEYEPLGAVATHESATDPHAGYLKESDAAANYVDKAGDTMTGSLYLNGSATAENEVVPASYVDDQVTDRLAQFPPAIYTGNVEPTDTRAGVVWFDTSGGAPGPGGVSLFENWPMDGYTQGDYPVASDFHASATAFGTDGQLVWRTTNPLYGSTSFLRCFMDVTKVISIPMPANLSEVYLRCLLRLTDTAAGNAGTFLSWRTATSPIATMRQGATGLIMRDSNTVNGTEQAVSSGDTAYIRRMEWRVKPGVDQTLRVWTDPASSGTPDVDYTMQCTVAGSVYLSFLHLGVVATSAGAERIDLDSLALSSEGWIGPVT